MIETIAALLNEWNKSTDSRQKLQHTYAFGGAIVLVIAGVVGLVNYQLGQLFLTIALVMIAIFFINAIIWALLTAFVLLRLNAKARARKR